MNRKQTFIKAALLTTTLIVGARPLAETVKLLPAIAQDTVQEFKLPASLPDNTKITVDGSHSMRVPNEALKKRFADKYAGTEINLKGSSTDEALAALLDNKIDLAAIGRSLTEAEKAKGLQQVLLQRGKVAVIVGADNPFKGNLTFDQFARMFRGEITDWQEVGGHRGQSNLLITLIRATPDWR
jgi:ABC-type phosphate transport system substrate-binding protein